MNTDSLFLELPRLESPMLCLDEIKENDLDSLFAIYDNEKVFDYCGIFPKHNMETVKNMIGHFRRDYNKQERIKWGIYPKDGNRILAGIIEVTGFEKKVNQVTLGYYLAESFWGLGIATEAVKLLVSFLFDKADVNRIHAEVMPANAASKKVLLKNGFLHEGTIRQGSIWPSKGLVDLEVYGILKSDYAS